MTTATEVEERWPTTKLQTSIFLANAADHIKSTLGRDYDDRKAGQLLAAKSDLLLAEVRIESWEVDLGIQGCVEDSSIGGVPCISCEDFSDAT